jgi:ribosomal protein S18 acetylase RimI-like enzyme
MEATLKHIQQYLEYDRKCYLLTYELNGSTMTLDYCVGDYFKIQYIGTDKNEQRKGQASKLIDKAKSMAKAKGFVEIQLYLPTDKYTHSEFFTKQDYDNAVSFYKKNGFKFYPKSSIKMCYKLTNKNNKKDSLKNEP